MKYNFCNEEECAICNKDEAVYKYVLIDGSTIDICQECGEILYNKNIKLYCPDRLFHIITLTEYVGYYKEYKKYEKNKKENVKTLVKY